MGVATVLSGPAVSVSLKELIANVAVAFRSAVTLRSVRAAVSTPSLQLTKWYPVFGVAVTSVRPASDLAAAPDEVACQELVELVTGYLDGVLPPGLKDKFQQHLNGCGGCSEYVRQIGLTIRALQQANLQLTP